MMQGAVSSLGKRASEMISTIMETITADIRTSFNKESIDAKSESTSSTTTTISGSSDVRNLRQVKMPEAKTGLGSMEGDLVHMARKYFEIVGLVFFVWLLGYFHFSVSWILLIVFIYLVRQRQRSRSKQHQEMLKNYSNNEEQYVKARLDELPSWVFFPDVERAEWVNRIIKQAWPYANKYLTENVFVNVIIPMIRSMSPALADFRFEKLDLGDIPPRIGGVKVYTDNVRDQIMMDLEVFYAGDARVKANLKGIVCGVKDIQFNGDMRVILSPLINEIPLAGAATYFFLRNPTIDFKLTDAGSLVDLPGLNDTMLSIINDIVANMMVLPNRQVFPLVANLPVGHLRWSNPQGVVRVFVIEANDLIKADITLLGKGKSDPYVRVKVQGTEEHKTKTINNTTDPKWNEAFECVVEQYESEKIEFEVYDEDPGKDDFIGRAQFPLESLVQQNTVDTWLSLTDVKKGRLHIRLEYFALTSQRSALELMDVFNRRESQHGKLAKALLVVYIDGCENLPLSRKSRQEPNPFCRVTVDHIEQQKGAREKRTETREHQTNPKFEHVSQILCPEPWNQTLTIDVCDARSNNERIGFVEYPIRQLLDKEAMTIDTSVKLKSWKDDSGQSSIQFRLSLYILTPGRENEIRLSPGPSSPTLSKAPSFDNPPGYSMNSAAGSVPNSSLGGDVRQSSDRRSTPTRMTSQNNSALNQLGPASIVLSPPSFDSSLEGKTILVSGDPDLESTGYGKIKIGIRYVTQRKCLSVTVFACQNLMKVHEQQLPDPYIRLYLLPDFKKEKKKTKSIHDTLDPIYEDLFEWPGYLGDVKRQRLYLSVKNNSPLFAQEQTYMGDLQIDLSNLDPEKKSIAWYALQEPNTSAVGMIKIKYEQGDLNERLTPS